MRSIIRRAPAGTQRRAMVPLALVAAGAFAASLGAVSPAQAISCPNELLRTGPGANLPDCRAYEMVSPPEKNGGEVDGGPTIESSQAPQQAALNGEAITYGSQTAFTGTTPSSGLLTSQYLSRRGPNGWYTQAITPEQDFPGGVFDKTADSEEFSPFQGFSEDLEHSFLVANDPSPVTGAPAGYFNPYLREDSDGVYRLLSTVTPPESKPGPSDHYLGLKIEYAGMSSDGSHVVFSASDALTPGAIPGRTNLYEWSDGRLELVSILPDGEVTSGGRGSEVMFGDPQYSQGGNGEGYSHVISADGSRVIWSRSYGENLGVYVSELMAGGARITHDPLPGRYETASVDGSKVLTNDGQLIQYEPAIGKLNELTPTTANVIEVLGASEDGSYVYFDAEGVLAPGASASLVNIYLWHDGAISFIAATGNEDYALHEGGRGGNPFPGSLNGGYLLLSNGRTRVSPDGRYLSFESSEPLTGYDNVPAEVDACEGLSNIMGKGEVANNPSGRCVEVYEYDATTDRLTCASCNPRDLPPLGNSIVPLTLHNIVHPVGWESTTVQQRYLLDDGRLFFDSTDELLPQATNAGKIDVYEYEPQGIGGCQREGGCLALISAGTSNDNSYFIDAGASGEDVFFVTREQLVAQDGDEALDMYDARVDGGFASAQPPPCGSEACRPPVTPAPALYGPPPSATFVGTGNPTQPTTQPAHVKARKKSKPRRPKRKLRAKPKRMAIKAKHRAEAHGLSSQGSHR